MVAFIYWVRSDSGVFFRKEYAINKAYRPLELNKNNN